jgi:hypothetical protein
VHDAKLIEELGIGYARGGNLRPHLQALGYSLGRLLEAGLIGPQGLDTFCHRVIFPCSQQDHIVNLYGRSIGNAFPHRLLPRSKGGLFAWESVRQFRDVILVEGLFDLAVLWQAGFRNTTCAIGTHLTPAQLAQLRENPDRCVYIAFDQDQNFLDPRGAPVQRPYMGGAPTLKMVAHYDDYNGMFEVDLWEEGKGFILDLTHEYNYELDPERREALVPALSRNERDHFLDACYSLFGPLDHFVRRKAQNKRL